MAMEQTGDAALRFDPDSAADMAAKILTVLGDDDLRASLIARGHERLRSFSRERYRETFASILNQALARAYPAAR